MVYDVSANTVRSMSRSQSCRVAHACPACSKSTAWSYQETCRVPSKTGTSSLSRRWGRRPRPRDDHDPAEEEDTESEEDEDGEESTRREGQGQGHERGRGRGAARCRGRRMACRVSGVERRLAERLPGRLQAGTFPCGSSAQGEGGWRAAGARLARRVASQQRVALGRARLRRALRAHGRAAPSSAWRTCWVASTWRAGGRVARSWGAGAPGHARASR